jgi:hypothetical protein
VTEQIVTRRNGVLCPSQATRSFRALKIPIPSFSPQGSMKLLTRNAVGGLVLEEHEVAPGEAPDSQPPCHAIAVLRIAAPCRMVWKDKGIEKAADLADGTLGLCTAEPFRGFRWDGNIRMLALHRNRDDGASDAGAIF